MSQSRHAVDSVWQTLASNANIQFLEHVDPEFVEQFANSWLGNLKTQPYRCHYRLTKDLPVAKGAVLPRYLDPRILSTRPDCGYESYLQISEPIKLPDPPECHRRLPLTQLCSQFGFQTNSLFRRSGCFNVATTHQYKKPFEYSNAKAAQYVSYPQKMMKKSKTEMHQSTMVPSDKLGSSFAVNHPDRVSREYSWVHSENDKHHLKEQAAQ